MRDELLLYYERELTYLRQMAVLFAQKYPKVASRLVLEANKCEDPHVERLLEGFAYLAARVHMKVDDEFPEITEALLGIVYPHFIRPVPSMSVVQFQLDLEQGKLTSGLAIERNAVLYSQSAGGTRCKFRTCYDTTLWPVNVAAAEYRTPDRLQPAVKSADSAHVFRLELKCGKDAEFPKLGMDSLRFHLSGESGIVNIVYELLCCNLNYILVRDPTNLRLKPVILPANALRPMGFEPDEAMIPYPRRSFAGYRLIQEFFTFPDKFFFFELNGLDQVWAAGFKNTAEIIFMLSEFEGEERRQRLEGGVSAKMFRLGCTPIINLFQQTAEPILLTQQKYEYPIVPDVRRPNATEVFSIDDVASIDPETRESVKYEPFYSFRHSGENDANKTFWLANRRPSARINDDGTEVYLMTVDLSLRPMRPFSDTLHIRTTCTNRDLPARLSFGSDSGDFELERNAPVKRIVALKKPTVPLRPAMGKAIQWKLISHLSLNYLSLVEEGREALQQILRLYDLTDSASARKMIEGITDVRSQQHFARVVSENGISFARGTKVELELDEDQYVVAGAYLFASVIENFLGLYASLNSFSQLSVHTKQRKEALREWPPRAGRRILI